MAVFAPIDELNTSVVVPAAAVYGEVTPRG
jgi:hypothetical protein